MLGLVATAILSMGGQKPKIPLYSEISHPDHKRNKTDTMNSEQIIEYLLNKL